MARRRRQQPKAEEAAGPGKIIIEAARTVHLGYEQHGDSCLYLHLDKGPQEVDAEIWEKAKDFRTSNAKPGAPTLVRQMLDSGLLAERFGPGGSLVKAPAMTPAQLAAEAIGRGEDVAVDPVSVS